MSTRAFADPLWLGAGALTAAGGATAALLSGTSPLGAVLAAAWTLTAAAVVAPAVSPAFSAPSSLAATATEASESLSPESDIDVSVRRGAGWLVAGTALALPLLGVFAALLLAKTHLRPLAAATFAVVALAVLAFGVLAARRLSAFAVLHPPRGAVVAVAALLIGAVAGAPLAALVLGPAVALCSRSGSPRLATLTAAAGAGLAALLLVLDVALGLGARVSLCAHAPWLAGPFLLGG